MFIHIVSIIMITITSLSVFASREAGNGGDGIFIGNKIFLYDFVEQGIHEKPYFDNTIVLPEHEITTLVENNLYMFPEKIRLRLATKLSEIFKIDKVFYSTLTLPIRYYSWAIINEFDLTEIDDEDGSDLNIPRDRFRQVAVRNLKTIKINKNLINKMNTDNAVGLILHEAIYSIIPLKEITNSNQEKYNHQSSRKAREINSYLFKEAFAKKGLKGLFAVVHDGNHSHSKLIGIPISKYKKITPKWNEENSFTFNWDLQFYSKEDYSIIASKFMFGLSPWDEDKMASFIHTSCDLKSGQDLITIYSYVYTVSAQHKQYKTFNKLRNDFEIKWHLDLNLRKNENWYFSTANFKDQFKLIRKKKSRKRCFQQLNSAWASYTSNLNNQ